jgi:RsiW-degrading membrane proteinase PrsW (M82 family)
MGLVMGADRTDPVQASDDGRDLYDIATWEQRSLLDAVAVGIYWLLVRTGQAVVVITALVIFFAIGGLSLLAEPATGVLTALSAIPALALAAYVWYRDITETEPVSVLAGTFILGVLTAGFAAVVNSILQPYFVVFGFLGLVLFFYLVVGPVEEVVKLLAVRLYAYKDDRFTAVIDGAVYGAVAGLGFAFIENALYIGRALEGFGQVGIGLGLIGMGADITATRALAGPGHVVYSAFAGYYLGLAKFNPGDRGPIVVKGLLIAALIHATYNATVGVASGAIHTATGIPELAASFLYILLYVGFFGALLIRKLERYRSAYRAIEDP